jgi:hypothetical protein
MRNFSLLHRKIGHHAVQGRANYALIQQIVEAPQIGADADSECEQRHNRKQRRAAQAAQHGICLHGWIYAAPTLEFAIF